METTQPPFQKDRCCRSGLPLSLWAMGPLSWAVRSGLRVPIEGKLTCASGELLGCPRWGAGCSARTGLPTELQELDERPRPGASNPTRLSRVVEFCFVTSLRHEDLPQIVESRRYGDSFRGCLSFLEPIPLCLWKETGRTYLTRSGVVISEQKRCEFSFSSIKLVFL